MTSIALFKCRTENLLGFWHAHIMGSIWPKFHIAPTNPQRSIDVLKNHQQPLFVMSIAPHRCRNRRHRRAAPIACMHGPRLNLPFHRPNGDPRGTRCCKGIFRKFLRHKGFCALRFQWERRRKAIATHHRPKVSISPIFDGLETITFYSLGILRKKMARW